MTTLLLKTTNAVNIYPLSGGERNECDGGTDGGKG
jgi:hypothetical protein